FADEIGRANLALADACDSVVLVVAGQPTWLKSPGAATAEAAAPAEPQPATEVPTAALVAAAAPATAPAPTAGPVFQPGMDLPLPDEEATERARVRLRGLDVPGSGLGALARVVEFAAGSQGRAMPRPW